MGISKLTIEQMASRIELTEKSFSNLRQEIQLLR